MLFSLKYVSHSVENLHEYIKHTIQEVCCKPNGAFSVNKLHPDFQAIVEAVSKNKNDYLKQPIEDIYNICLTLDTSQLKIISDAFSTNNAIEDLCEGRLKPFLYEDIEKISVPLSEKLKQFCKDLFNHVLKLKSYSSTNGEIDEHYDKFMVENSIGICPFCGLSDLKSDNLSKRDAYDHYLPKNTYPFNTVNFKNLIPACNTCNSSYKLAKDPISKGNRTAFYPFSAMKPSFEIGIKISSIDFDNPKNNVISISITSAKQVEVNSWRDTYGIDELYNDKCRSEDSKYWIIQITELINSGYDIKSYFPTYIQNRKSTPYLEKNFLRVPFLEECMLIGVFG